MVRTVCLDDMNAIFGIHSAYTLDKFVLICPTDFDWFCLTFERKRFDITY